MRCGNCGEILIVKEEKYLHIIWPSATYVLCDPTNPNSAAAEPDLSK